MAQELIYTSAERGVRLGTSGFCTVAHTRGMLPQTMQLLEALSTYRMPMGMTEWQTAPVVWSHLRWQGVGRNMDVLSRIGAAAADHTNRTNKLAHHLLIDARERPAGGPAWLCDAEGLFVSDWSGEPRLIDAPRELPTGDETEFRADTWKLVTGDAGNAGMLASWTMQSPERVTVIVFTPEMPMLALLREALRLLPVAQRWNVTFSSYFTTLPAGAACQWRCCLADSDELQAQKRIPRVRIMDLTAPLPPPEEGNPQVIAARNGHASSAPAQEAEPTEKKIGFTLLPRRSVNQFTLRPRN